MGKSPLISYEELVEKIVEEAMGEKNDNPRDSTFRFLQEYHAKAQHESLRYPGKFVKTLGTETFTVNNRNLRMDGAELVNADDTIPCQSTLNPEQQTTEIDKSKIHAMYDYKLQLTFKHKMPCLNVVVTNIGDEDYTVIYESHGDAFKVYVRVFNDAEISKRLNILSYKIKHKKELTEIEVLDFAYILLFAQEKKAKKYSEVVVGLFCEVKNLDKNLQLDIHYVLKKLIRLHFRNDDKKTWEMLTLITKAIHPNVLKEIPTIQKMLKKLEESDNLIMQKDKELSKKDKEIIKLKKQLTENNIEVDD